MGKALKTAGAIIGGAVLIATGVGALAGLNVAAMGIASFTGSLTIGQLGMISAGMSAVGGMLDKPKSSGAAPATDWTSNADQPTPFAFGRVGVAGKIVHWDEYGKDNKLKSFVSVYSGAGPIKGFVSFKAGDLPVSFASNGGTAIGKYNRQMWRSWKVGNQPDTALPLPTGLDEAAIMPQWGASYKLSGKACDLWTLQQDSKLSVYPGNAEPKPLTVLEGIYGYDHRYDSTYPGGFGDCRLDDRSTWRWIENPIIAALNWALGMKENGQVVGGVGALASGIDLPAFAEAANIAEANDWKVSAWPDTSQDASVVLDQLLQAGGALRARHAGKISCVSRGAARPSIVTITRRDTAGPIELDTGASRFNRINTITPVFMSEARGWKLWPADPVTFAAFRTEDGGRTGDKIDYPFVPELQQAAQLAAYDILDAREPFSGTIPLKPHMRRLKRGDCFDIDEPGFLLDGVKCMVLGRSYDSSKGEVRIAFRSETDGKHDLALGKTTVLPEYPTLTPVDPTLVSPPLPEDWTIVVRPPAPGGTQLPGFDLTGIVSNSTATAIIVEHGPTAEGPWTTAYQGPPTVTNIPIDGLQPGATYYIAIQYQRNQNYSTREVYGPYTAPALIGDVMPNAPGLSQIKSDIEAAFGDIFAVDALVAQARTDIDAQGVEIAAARGGQPSLAARVAQLAQATIDGDTANATAISLVQARTANTEADIIDLENALATEAGARAEAIQQVNARLVDLPNMLPNSTAASDLALWTAIGSWTRVVDPAQGSLFFSSAAGDNYLISNVIPATGGQTHTVSFNSETGGGPAAVWVQAFKAGAQNRDNLGRLDYASADWSVRRACPSFTLQPDEDGYRIVLQKNAAAPYNGVKMIMANFGPARDWRDDATQRVLGASVTQQSLAIIDLENNAAIASWQVKAVATGGKPAVIQAVSSTLGGFIAFGAEQIYFGDNTVFDDATDTIQTVWGSTRKTMAWGAPFGPDNLVEWTGSSSIALGSMTKANAGFWVDQAGAYGPTPMPSFWARVTPTQITRSRTGAGSISTAVNDVIVSCYTGTSGATCTWSRVSGDTSIGFPATGFAPTFSTTVAVGQIKTALFVGLVAKGGDVDLVYVNVEFQENT